ncbi:MAG: hypothetical protein ACREC6_11815 [Hyphomicrobiaceae bacterium]
MRIVTIAVFSSVVLAAAAGADETGRTTGCDFASLDRHWSMDGGVRRYANAQWALPLRFDVPVYPDDSEAAAEIGKVAFNQRVLIVDSGTAGRKRFKVTTEGQQPLGWVDRGAMLCRREPLTDADSGLLRRMVVRTVDIQGDTPTAKTAWHSPVRQECQDGRRENCRQASRFQWYFVYHEENGHVLLADNPHLARTDTFLGWLSKDDGFAWNTAAGLRPADAPQERLGPAGRRDRFVCAYPDRASIGTPDECRPILGSKIWYETDVRMAILADDGAAYDVAGPAAAQTRQFHEMIQAASQIRKVDVFFVVDGTKSMAPVVAAIRGGQDREGLIDRIRKKLALKLADGGVLRLGFRIYRDSLQGGRDGIENSEFLALPGGDKCDSNEAQFLQQFQKVEAVDTQSDPDFFENVNGALDKLRTDLLSCPNHLKLVILIGDHGYDPAAQQAKGFRAVPIGDIARRLKQGTGGLAYQPVLLAIQTANYSDTIVNRAAYDQAFAAFERQSKELLAAVYAGTAVKRPPADFFHRLPRDVDTAVVDEIMKPIDDLMQPAGLAQLTSMLTSGESLTEAIRRLHNNNRLNIPAIWFDVVEQGLCDRLGPQCREKVIEGVFRGVIPHSDDLETEILLTLDERRRWIEILSAFYQPWDSWLRSQVRVREETVRVMAESVAGVIKQEIDDRGENIGYFVGKKAGLPYGARSPLLAYTPEELRSSQKVPSCEIEHILAYAGKKLEILRATEDGEHEIVFSETAMRPEVCLQATDKGKTLQIVEASSYRVVPLNQPGDHTYRYKVVPPQGGVFYWLKKKYLP